MWSINYGSQSLKFLEKSDKQTAIRILKYLQKVLLNPKSYGKSLTGGLQGLWRYRVGDYRIICELSEKELVVLVVDIGHRKEIYKKVKL